MITRTLLISLIALFLTAPAGAQSLTDSIQARRMTVLEVKKDAGQLGHLPAEEAVVAMLALRPLHSTLIGHHDSAIIVGEDGRAGLVASFYYDGTPAWILDEWQPLSDGWFLVTGWRFYPDKVSRAEFLRRGGAIKEVVGRAEVAITPEVIAKSRLTWEILCQNFACSVNALPIEVIETATTAREILCASGYPCSDR